MKKSEDSHVNSRMYQEITDELEASYQQLKSATELLQESEQKYKLLIDNMTDIVWVTDTNGILTFINDEVEKMLGYKREAVLDKPLYNIMCPLHQYDSCNDITAEMKNRDFYRQELWMLHYNGTTRKVVETNTRRIYSNGTLVGIQGLGRDVTERLQLEKKLRKKNEQLAALNEISSAIASSDISLNENILIENISEKIVEIMNISLCSVRLIREDGKLHCSAAAGPFKAYINTDPITVNESMFKSPELYADKAAFISMCKQFTIEHSQGRIGADDLSSTLFVPLVLNNAPMGIITVCSTDSFDEEYIDLLRSIANNLAFAVEKADLYKKSKNYYLKTIMGLVAAIDAKDKYTQGHSIRVSQYAIEIARELGMSNEEIEEVEIAGILHDIGKIGISDAILTKPGVLEPHEFEMVKEHPAIGCRILQTIGLSENITNATLLHHKRFDLQGYPEDVPVKELPLMAKIICVADAYDAMISYRSYKAPMSRTEALNELRRCSGTQFCPDIVRTMESLYNKRII